MNLQAQLASLKEQAAQCIIDNTSNNTTNPNESNICFPHDDVQSLMQNQVTMPQFDASMSYNSKYEENTLFGSTDSVEVQPNKRPWQFVQDDADELQSVALRYLHLS